jgi:hypothetical protein
MGVETILRASRLTATPAMTDDNQLSFNCHLFRARKSQLRSMVADFPRIAA